ncbi:MAG: ABC transporter ATP-binding protein [Desulfobacteraceae bacterium]|nr:ABC transporter ATP-binding protein [Desulfobacteraceae bacterium]MBC2754899.1 ABC transporter ATP-binding protein [Desulfobacteraceae bacterium]
MSSNIPDLESFQNNDLTVSVQHISKMFPLYNSPWDRIKQKIWRNRNFFEKFWALQDVSFDLKQGEARGLLGHNGAGKSTLLQILVGTLKPSSGSAFIRGRVGAIMTMGSGFKQDFTGRENAYVLGALMDISKDAIDRRMDRIIDFAEVGPFFDRPVRTYSSGMLARLAFGIYTCLEPDLLIVDEAISVGDAAFKQKCLEHISELLKNGMSMLLVSHSPPIIESFCDNATVFERGHIIFDGDVGEAIEVYKRKRSRK